MVRCGHRAADANQVGSLGAVASSLNLRRRLLAHHTANHSVYKTDRCRTPENLRSHSAVAPGDGTRKCPDRFAAWSGGPDLHQHLHLHRITP